MIYYSNSDTFERKRVVVTIIPKQYTLALSPEMDIPRSYICDIQKISKHLWNIHKHLEF